MNLKVKDKIKQMLIKYPDLKDCDERLLANLWFEECEAKGIKTLYEFFRHYSKGQLSNSESVRRSRQKLQEDHPELRGKNYKQRKSHAKDVRQELGYKS